MVDKNLSNFFKDFSLKDFAYLLFIIVILVGGFLLIRKDGQIKKLKEELASVKPDTIFVQGQVVTDTLIKPEIKIDTIQIITEHFDTCYFVDTNIVSKPCAGTILLKDSQPLFDMRAKVRYPKGNAEFIYHYKTQPDKWVWTAGFGFYNNWKPFVVSDIGKGNYGIGGVLSSDRWGLFIKRKF